MKIRRAAWLAAVVVVGGGMPAVAARGDLFGVGGNAATQNAPTLLRFSPGGQSLGPFPAVNPPRSEEFTGLTRGPDGALYFLGNILGGGSIVKVTTAGSAGAIYNEPGDPSAAKLTSPAGVGFDTAGKLYVTSNALLVAPGVLTDTTRVYRYDGPNTLTSVYSLAPSAQVRLGDVEFDSSNAMYVGVSGAGIRKLVGGAEAYTIPTAATLDFKFGPDGMLYVPSRTAGVLRYDPSTGTALGAFVAPGAGGLVDAMYIAFGDDGSLYVNDPVSTVVRKYSAATGASQGTFSDYTPEPGTNGPNSIAFASVPEPGAVAGLAAAAAAGIIGRGRRRAR